MARKREKNNVSDVGVKLYIWWGWPKLPRLGGTLATLYIPYIKLVFGQSKPLPGVTLATGSLYIYFYVFEVRESEYELSFTFYGHLDTLNPIWPPFYYIK